ncbi:hypothetical protein TorRG33x02_021190 [Trema orientale]|uniref:Uncharacterized protein n=1 Tax=Trema orientale TaxID=63057 RepID=A0A2P5FX44_TREOI|nr:hypothetical protein TorRG33x02_021190 [Trema orientale]
MLATKRTPRDEEPAIDMEMDATDVATVVLELVNECSHLVMPKLDYTALKTRQEEPCFLTVKTQPLYYSTLGLQCYRHPSLVLALPSSSTVFKQEFPP